MRHMMCPACGEHYQRWFSAFNRPKPCRRCDRLLRILWPAYFGFPVAPILGWIILGISRRSDIPAEFGGMLILAGGLCFVGAYFGIVCARLVAMPAQPSVVETLKER